MPGKGVAGIGMELFGWAGGQDLKLMAEAIRDHWGKNLNSQLCAFLITFGEAFKHN